MTDKQDIGVVTQADREAAAAAHGSGWMVDLDKAAEAFRDHRLASQADQGWIVSNGAGDKWRTWDVLGPVWTGHRDQATRYARRIDAENVHREDEDRAVPLHPPPAVAER